MTALSLAIWIVLGALAFVVLTLVVLGVIRMRRRDPTDPVFGKGKEPDE